MLSPSKDPKEEKTLTISNTRNERDWAVFFISYAHYNRLRLLFSE
ncbi:unnamed protein product [Moneuplotes crassus]|uniref:Uncharacterized protein n=1 Tax=Euplotes crassus TaxID=5936 RepID=A0AAD1XN57_EUPCR|nr:unnamed protein product [Moneuplotes crassus]